MIIRFPYLYTGIVARGAREQRVSLGAWAEVDVTEVEDHDAPVAVTYASETENGTPYEVAVRNFGGDFYRPRTSVAADRYKPAADDVDNLTVNDLIQRRPLFTSYATVENLDLPDHVNRDLHKEFDPYDAIAARADAGDVPAGRSNQAEILEQHVRAAESLIIIGGEIWERCPTPELEIDFFWTPPKAEVVYLGKGRPGGPSEKAMVPLHVADAVLDDLVLAMSDPTLLQGAHARAWTPADVGVPQIHCFGGVAPGAAAVDYAVSRAREFLSQCASKYDHSLERFSTAYIREWADFKDAIENALDKPSAEANRAMMDGWRKMAESLSGELPRMGGLVKKHFRRVLIRTSAELEASQIALFPPDLALDASPAAPKM